MRHISTLWGNKCLASGQQVYRVEVWLFSFQLLLTPRWQRGSCVKSDSSCEDVGALDIDYSSSSSSSRGDAYKPTWLHGPGSNRLTSAEAITQAAPRRENDEVEANNPQRPSHDPSQTQNEASLVTIAVAVRSSDQRSTIPPLRKPETLRFFQNSTRNTE